MADPSARAQLDIDFVDPHHTITFQYPTPHLLTGPETLWMLSPLAASSRYEPSPLINDERVINNASTDNHFETSYFVFSKADTSQASPVPALLNATHPKLDRLLHDSAAMQSTVGDTHIQFALYTIAGSEELWVRVCRTSAFRHLEGVEWKNQVTYDFTLKELEDAIHGSSGSIFNFLLSMYELINQSTDRAYQHVSHHWQAIGGVMPRWVWMRRPAVDQAQANLALLPAVDVTTLKTDDFCSICLLEFDIAPAASEDHTPTRLPCGHTFGRGCIRRWVAQFCGQNSMELCTAVDATCPMCRQLALPLDIGKDLRFGIVDGIYGNGDHRYDDYEHFERSCADLDDHADISADNTVYNPIRGDVIKQAYLFMLEFAKLESPSRTPYRLQTVHFPEIAQASEVVCFSLDNTDGLGLTTRTLSELAKAIEGTARGVLLIQTRTPGFLQFLEPGHVEHRGFLKANPADFVFPPLYPLRLGTEQFLHRFLSRAIYFQSKRACKCMPGFHNHGFRAFYNPSQEYTEDGSVDIFALMETMLASG